MFGEILLCEFPFTSGTSSKIRPALVLFELPDDVIICRVTSILYSGPNDVTLKDWLAAGLLKPSVARLDRIITAEKRILIRKLGALSMSDTERVRSVWNSRMRL
jgi:mRNA interferase MazF